MRHLSILLIAIGSALSLSAQTLPDETFVDEYDESQYGHGATVARFTFADKYVVLIHDGKAEETAIRNMPVVSGDLLKTKHGSYAEIELIDGSLMQFGDRATVEFQAVNEIYERESLSVIKLYQGSVFLHVTDEWQGAESRVFRIDTSAGSTYIEAPGVYRVDMEGGRMKLKVYRGFAELSGERDSQPVYSGEYATIRNMTRPSQVRPFNSFRSDAFERWAYDRRPAGGVSVSANYVDEKISIYARDLDDYGEWRYHPEYRAHVWAPYVEASWRPYHRGYWLRRGGPLTWISYDPFGWVTHHYGRWSYSLSFGWHWIPGYRYSPAWVAWTTYDSYIGWCPLGYWNRPYYYWRGRPNLTIYNHHDYRWTYVSSTRIVKRSRNYNYERLAHRGPRRISRSAVYVNRDDLSSGSRLSMAVRNTDANRDRAVSYRARRSGSLTAARGLATDRSAKATTTRIASRSTGTKAVSRHRHAVTRSRDGYITHRAPRADETSGRRVYGDAASRNGVSRGASEAGRSSLSSRQGLGSRPTREIQPAAKDRGATSAQRPTRQGSTATRQGSTANRQSSTARKPRTVQPSTRRPTREVKPPAKPKTEKQNNPPKRNAPAIERTPRTDSGIKRVPRSEISARGQIRRPGRSQGSSNYRGTTRRSAGSRSSSAGSRSDSTQYRGAGSAATARQSSASGNGSRAASPPRSRGSSSSAARQAQSSSRSSRATPNRAPSTRRPAAKPSSRGANRSRSSAAPRTSSPSRSRASSPRTSSPSRSRASSPRTSSPSRSRASSPRPSRPRTSAPKPPSRAPRSKPSKPAKRQRN